MRFLSVLLLLLLSCPVAFAETFVIDLGDGTCVLTDGDEATRYKLIRLGGDDPPPPPDDDDDEPDDPDEPEPKTLKERVADWAGDVDDPDTATRLAVAYREVGRKAADGTFDSKQQADDAMRSIFDALAGPEWDAFDRRLSQALDAMEAAGHLNTLNELAVAYQDIAEGLSSVGNALDPAESPKLFRTIYSHIFKAAGGDQ